MESCLFQSTNDECRTRAAGKRNTHQSKVSYLILDPPVRSFRLDCAWIPAPATDTKYENAKKFELLELVIGGKLSQNKTTRSDWCVILFSAAQVQD